jgi:hypothetical protein
MFNQLRFPPVSSAYLCTSVCTTSCWASTSKLVVKDQLKKLYRWQWQVQVLHGNCNSRTILHTSVSSTKENNSRGRQIDTSWQSFITTTAMDKNNYNYYSVNEQKIGAERFENSPPIYSQTDSKQHCQSSLCCSTTMMEHEDAVSTTYITTFCAVSTTIYFDRLLSTGARTWLMRTDNWRWICQIFC